MLVLSKCYGTQETLSPIMNLSMRAITIFKLFSPFASDKYHSAIFFLFLSSGEASSYMALLDNSPIILLQLS